jgi:quercetin dioxygenase-like cupin family protein/DNA-binding transcriptional regulator YiaG
MRQSKKGKGSAVKPRRKAVKVVARGKPLQRATAQASSDASMAPPQLVGATLREQRRRLNLTLETVAHRIGITKGFLSEVERDRATPSVATLMRLREALSLSIASVFISTQPRIVRAKNRQEIFLGGTNIAYSLLSGRDAHRVTVVWGKLDPGAQSGPDMHTLPADEEIICVLSGSFEITMDGHKHTLRPGDAFTFDPRRPHRYENPSKTTPMVAICVIAPPPKDQPGQD